MILKRLFKSVVFIVLLLSMCAPARAQSEPSWVEADGEAYLGDMDTPKDVKERAKKDAEARAVELAAGAFIKAHAVVSNSQLAEDLVFASVRGRIEKAEVVKEGWDARDRNLYRVKLRALVAPVYKDNGQGLGVTAHLSKTELREGEEVKIFYRLNSDGYAYIFSVGADGSVTLLYPNSRERDNRASASVVYEFPSDRTGFRLKAMFLPGFNADKAEERIKVIATSKKEDLIPLGFKEGVFNTYDAKSTGMIGDLIRRLSQMEPSEWAEASAEYVIVK